MDSAGKSAGAVTPIKDHQGSSRSKKQENPRHSENLNPNVSPGPRSAKSQKSGSKNPNPNPNPNPKPVVFQSPRKKIRERKFVVAKKRVKKEDPDSNPDPNPNAECGKCKERGSDSKKCVCLAYETLRASQEEFFKTRPEPEPESGSKEADREIEEALLIQDWDFDEADPTEETGPGCSTVKRRRARLLEEARQRQSVPERGKVMHLVQAFEKLLTIPKGEEEGGEEESDKKKKKATKWALPGLQPPQAHESSSSSFCPSDLFLTSENLGLDRRPPVSTSWGGSLGSVSNNGGRRSRRNSSESSGTIGGSRWKKKQQQRATSLKPFKLRTEERGRMKGEEFMKKVQEMMIQEERQRIPIAQGLPWTTDEPECLIKPPVKESTRPTDPKLDTDVRAVERAEFDHQVAEKLSLFEQYKMERERLQKLAEEEEVRRLRKELVPKAQPMPYFDRPFIPRRSMKHPTIPKDPKFHIPQHKKIKCCMSWNDDMSSYSYQSEA